MKITVIVQVRRSYFEIYWYCKVEFTDCVTALVLMSGLEEFYETQKGLMLEGRYLKGRKND